MVIKSLALFFVILFLLSYYDLICNRIVKLIIIVLFYFYEVDLLKKHIFGVKSLALKLCDFLLFFLLGYPKSGLIKLT